MLPSFLLKNYRLFKHLEISGLQRVNLVVGKNNAGKSALLEAIELYATDMSTETLIDHVVTRQETWATIQQTSTQRTYLNPVRHIFFEHQLPQLGEEGIILGPLEPVNKQLHLYMGAFRMEGTPEGLRRRVLVSPQDVLESAEDLEDVEVALIVTEDGKIRRTIRLDRDIQDEAHFFRKNASLGFLSTKYATQVVPTRNMTEEKLATLWDSINLTGLDEEVIQGLRLLDDGITGIAFVENSSSRNGRIPLVKLDYQPEPLPLKSLGDGIMRLFHIVVALVNARDGILIVDEFENGLHWSVQPKVWEMVFRLAETLQVQIFASTHSQDCIRGFESAWSNKESQGSFFRLQPSQNKSVSITYYNRETLSDALETDVEVR